jgi:pyruvate dehydrogenase E2 component (dihydrolipoamide acetyltransferase)
VGDTVKAEQSLITVESDKASMEFPSSRRRGEGTQGRRRRQGEGRLGGAGGRGRGRGCRSPGTGAGRCTCCRGTRSGARTGGCCASGRFRSGRRQGAGHRRLQGRGRHRAAREAGDTIKAEQSLITVESDKASMEIPSSAAGVLKELKVKVGDKVNIGDLIAVLEGTAGALLRLPHPGSRTGGNRDGQSAGAGCCFADAGC